MALKSRSYIFYLGLVKFFVGAFFILSCLIESLLHKLAGEQKMGGGVNMAVTELGFGHITTKTWAYFGVFGFQTKMLSKNSHPHPNYFFEKRMGNPFLELNF